MGECKLKTNTLYFSIYLIIFAGIIATLMGDPITDILLEPIPKTFKLRGLVEDPLVKTSLKALFVFASYFFILRPIGKRAKPRITSILLIIPLGYIAGAIIGVLLYIVAFIILIFAKVR